MKLWELKYKFYVNNTVGLIPYSREVQLIHNPLKIWRTVMEISDIKVKILGVQITHNFAKFATNFPTVLLTIY